MNTDEYLPVEYGVGYDRDGHPLVLRRGGFRTSNAREDVAWHVHCTVHSGHIADARHLARLLNAGQQ